MKGTIRDITRIFLKETVVMPWKEALITYDGMIPGLKFASRNPWISLHMGNRKGYMEWFEGIYRGGRYVYPPSVVCSVRERMKRVLTLAYSKGIAILMSFSKETPEEVYYTKDFHVSGDDLAYLGEFPHVFFRYDDLNVTKLHSIQYALCKAIEKRLNPVEVEVRIGASQHLYSDPREIASVVYHALRGRPELIELRGYDGFLKIFHQSGNTFIRGMLPHHLEVKYWGRKDPAKISRLVQNFVMALEVLSWD